MHQVELLFRGEGVGGLLRILSALQLGCASDVAAAVTNQEGVGACLGEPLAASLVEGGKVAYGNGHRERLTLAGLQLTGLGDALIAPVLA